MESKDIINKLTYESNKLIIIERLRELNEKSKNQYISLKGNTKLNNTESKEN